MSAFNQTLGIAVATVASLREIIDCFCNLEPFHPPMPLQVAAIREKQKLPRGFLRREQHGPKRFLWRSRVSRTQKRGCSLGELVLSCMTAVYLGVNGTRTFHTYWSKYIRSTHIHMHACIAMRRRSGSFIDSCQLRPSLGADFPFLLMRRGNNETTTWRPTRLLLVMFLHTQKTDRTSPSQPKKCIYTELLN